MSIDDIKNALADEATAREMLIVMTQNATDIPETFRVMAYLFIHTMTAVQFHALVDMLRGCIEYIEAEDIPGLIKHLKQLSVPAPIVGIIEAYVNHNQVK